MNILSFSRLNDEPPFLINAAELVQPRNLDFLKVLISETNPENLTEESRRTIANFRDKVQRLFPDGVS